MKRLIGFWLILLFAQLPAQDGDNYRQGVNLPDIRVDVIDVGILQEREKEEIPYLEPLMLRFDNVKAARTLDTRDRNKKALLLDYRPLDRPKRYYTRPFLANLLVLAGNNDYTEVDFFEGSQKYDRRHLINLHYASGNKEDASFTNSDLALQCRWGVGRAKYFEVGLKVSRAELSILGDDTHAYPVVTRDGESLNLHLEWGLGVGRKVPKLSFDYEQHRQAGADNSLGLEEISERALGVGTELKTPILGVPFDLELDFASHAYDETDYQQYVLRGITQKSLLQNRLKLRLGLHIDGVRGQSTLADPYLELVYFTDDTQQLSFKCFYQRSYLAPDLSGSFADKEYLQLGYGWVVPEDKRNMGLSVDMVLESGFSAALRLSQSRSAGYLVPVASGNNDGFWELSPLDEVKIERVELLLHEYLLRRIKPYLSYAVNKSRTVGGQKVPYVPEDEYVAGVSMPGPGLTATLEYRYTGQRGYSQIAGTAKLPGYGLLHLTLEQEVLPGRLFLALRGANMSGTSYQPISGYTYDDQSYHLGARYVF